MNGLICNIYKPGYGSCSNNGISQICNEVLLTGINCDVFNESEKIPAVKIAKKNYHGQEYVYAVPVKNVESGNNGWMMGGCFIYSSDSRFPFKHPIALHDRQEKPFN